MAVAAPPTNASNVDLVRWAFETLNAHDVEPLKQFWTNSTVERFPDRTCRGAEEIAAYFHELFTGIPDWRFEIKGIAGEGDHVFIQWRATGTHSGPLLGIEPTGKPIALDGIDHFAFADGTVLSNFVVVDRLQLAEAIGLLPPDGSAADRAMKAAFNVKTKVAARLRR
jgi:predicted ester cyclase